MDSCYTMMPQVAALDRMLGNWHSWVVLRSTPGGDIYVACIAAPHECHACTCRLSA